MLPMTLKMAWRNVWRNPRRSILTMGAITFASALLVFMLSFQFGSYDTMINASVRIQTGHLQIQADGYRAKKDVRRVIENPDAIHQELAAMPGIAGATPRAAAFSLASSETRSYGVMVVGIDPSTEREVSTLTDLVREGAFLEPGEPETALIGERLARNLKIGLGNEVVLLGQGRDGSVAAGVVRVKGIFRSGIDTLDRSTLHIPIATFQSIYTMGGAVHEIVIVTGRLGAVPALKAQVSHKLAAIDNPYPLLALDWTELVPGLLQSIQLDLISGLIFYAILAIVVAFSIMNTFLMAIFERKREFGVLMALGTAPGRLLGLVLAESALLTAVGITAGIAIGAAVTAYFQTTGIDLAGSSEILAQYGISGRIHPRLGALSILLGPGLVWFVTVGAALVPAFRIRGLQPVEALKD